MITIQTDNLKKTLEWIETCPFHYTISSMQGGFIHLKIQIPHTSLAEYEKSIWQDKNEKTTRYTNDS